MFPCLGGRGLCCSGTVFQMLWLQDISPHFSQFCVRPVSSLGKFKHWCDRCQKGFSRTSHYEDHMAAKHEGIIHSCNMCEKLFTSRRGRDLHMNTHTGVYPFSCLVFQRGFNYKKHLQAHEKSKH